MFETNTARPRGKVNRADVRSTKSGGTAILSECERAYRLLPLIVGAPIGLCFVLEAIL